MSETIITSVRVDSEVHALAKEYGINISKAMNDLLTELVLRSEDIPEEHRELLEQKESVNKKIRELMKEKIILVAKISLLDKERAKSDLKATKQGDAIRRIGISKFMGD